MIHNSFLCSTHKMLHIYARHKLFISSRTLARNFPFSIILFPLAELVFGKIDWVFINCLWKNKEWFGDFVFIKKSLKFLAWHLLRKIFNLNRSEFIRWNIFHVCTIYSPLRYEKDPPAKSNLRFYGNCLRVCLLSFKRLTAWAIFYLQVCWKNVYIFSIQQPNNALKVAWKVKKLAVEKIFLSCGSNSRISENILWCKFMQCRAIELDGM